MLQENKARQILRKTNISKPLKWARTCAYEEARNVRFPENLTCFAFLCQPFWEIHPFPLSATICLILTLVMLRFLIWRELKMWRCCAQGSTRIIISSYHRKVSILYTIILHARIVTSVHCVLRFVVPYSPFFKFVGLNLGRSVVGVNMVPISVFEKIQYYIRWN